MFIDTHCHIQDREAFPDPEQEVAAAFEVGVERLVVVGVNPEDWPQTLLFADSHSGVFAALGWHPNYTADYSSEQLSHLRSLLSQPKVLAVGEIGLDYHWDYSPKDRQFEALQDQLNLADEMEMPVIFHAREAYADLLNVLEERGPRHGYLLHCFAGDETDAARAVELGCLFGVDGPISYKKADELRRVISTIPRDRIVLETDSPYLSPVPFRGKPNRPAYVPHIASALASVWGESPQEVASITTANAIRFFGQRLA